MPSSSVNGGFLFGGLAFLAASTNVMTAAMNEKIKELILSHFPGYDSIQEIGECECWICGDGRENGGDLRDHIWKKHRKEI